MKLLVLAGTQDGRELGEELHKAGYEVVLSTLTAYGAELAQAQGLSARFGAFSKESLRLFLEQESIRAVVDATHPYAQVIQKLAHALCTERSLPYVRWERPGVTFQEHPLVHWAQDLTEAGAMAAVLGQRILLTTGSNSLPEFLNMPCLRDKTLFVRVLPTASVLARCESLRLKPRQIIAAQGPFSKAFNKALFEQLQAEVVIAKDSGPTGGTQEKIEACLETGIPIILLKRPNPFGEHANLLEFVSRLEEKLCQLK
ncbi:precorrin-6A reductase [Paradesulfitobacterium aromaticivorans]